MPRTAGRPQRLRALAHRLLAGRDDSGFTLLEVVIAVVLLTAVMLTAAGFMVKSTATSNGFEGRQSAVTVARQVMEEVRAVPPTFATSAAGVTSSPLVKGRSRGDSTAAWTTAGVTTSDSYTGSGSTTFDQHAYELASGTSVNPLVPFVTTKVVDDRTFTARTLIGTCKRVRTTGTCTKTGTGDELFRVVVVVTWTDATCTSATACRYVLPTLIDPTQQATFNVNQGPVAFDDPDDGAAAITVGAGSAVDISVLGNDSGSFPVSGGVAVSQAPTYGSVAVKSGTNQLTYTAQSTYSGPVTFLYVATDVTGATSNSALVSLTATPVAVDDTVATTTRTTTLDVLANDRGTKSGAVPEILTQPSGATATVSGTGISFTAGSATARTYTFTYRMVSGSLSSPPATVSVTVNPPAAPTASNRSASTTVGNDVSIPLSGAYAPSDGTLTTNQSRAVVNGTTVTYSPSSTTAATETFTYTVTDTWGRSATATVTVSVTLPARPVTPDRQVIVSAASGTVDLGTDIGATWSTPTATFTVAGDSRATQPNGNTSPRVLLQRPASGTYTITYTVTDSARQSSTGTIIVRRN